MATTREWMPLQYITLPAIDQQLHRNQDDTPSVEISGFENISWRYCHRRNVYILPFDDKIDIDIGPRVSVISRVLRVVKRIKQHHSTAAVASERECLI